MLKLAVTADVEDASRNECVDLDNDRFRPKADIRGAADETLAAFDCSSPDKLTGKLLCAPTGNLGGSQEDRL